MEHATNTPTIVFVISLAGQGDIWHNVVDSETWEWLGGGKLPPGPLERAIASWREDNDGDPEAADLPDHQSPGNDRMLAAPSAQGFHTYFSAKDLVDAVTAAGARVEASCEGYIY